VGTQDLTGSAGGRVRQVATTLSAGLRPGRVAGVTVGTVHIRPSLGSLDFLFIGDKLLLRWLFEFHVLWLRCATAAARLLRARVL
jgi:hypothetical protein